MKRILLVVTGDLEKLALAASLKRTLEAVGAEVTFDESLKVDSVTSGHPLPSAAGPKVPSTVRRLAKALVEETWRGRSRTPPDLVVGIDDLELGNTFQPDVVVAWVRRAVQEEIERSATAKSLSLAKTEELRVAMRSRCSFHLLVPLVEAYFFGHPAALMAARVASSTPVHRVGKDVEDFETDDPGFLPIARAENEQKASNGMPWWREERHPKHYLDFLVQQAADALPYGETTDGKRALDVLDWPAAASLPATMAFARAMFEDLSDLLGIPNPLGPGDPHPQTYPAKSVRRETLTLRNL